MSLPKAGKVNIKTPQNTAGSPSISSGSVRPSAAGNPIKILIQQGTKHSRASEKSSHGTPSAAPKPSKSGTKVSPVIQTGTPGSRTK